MAKKIILSVTNDTYADRRIHKMAMKLHSMGHRVEIVGRYSKQKTEKPVYASIIRLRMLFKKKFVFYAEYNFKLFFYLLFKRVDILFSNDLDTLPANSLISFLRRKKLIYDSHELFVESPEIIGRKRVQNIWKKIEKICIRRIHQGITVSQPIADHYKRIYNKGFLVIRNVPFYNDPDEKDVTLPEFMNHPRIVLYQGSLNVGRGLETAIEAFKHINDARLIIIGSGDIEKDLIKKTKSLKLEEKVFFTGRVSQAKLASFTKQAAIGLSIEKHLGKNYEYALPNKLFDYIKAEVPVVISSLPEMQKIVEKYKVGEVIDLSSELSGQSLPVKLSGLIKSLLTNPERTEQYRQNCRIAAKELCWEKETAVLDNIKFLKQLL